MLIPLSDDDRDLIKPAFITWALVTLNLVVFVIQSNNPEFTLGYAAIPAEITTGEDLIGPVQIQLAPGKFTSLPHTAGPKPIQLTLLSSMFMHGGIAHLAGNLLFLWIFGDNVEHRFGHLPFLLFYLMSGLAASIAHVVMNFNSVVPSLGASGAIAGVLGAYLVLFPRNRVYAIFIIWMVTLPAFVVIAMWAVAQFVGGFQSLSGVPGSGGIAYAAHIGGFIAGAALALLFRNKWQAEPASVFRQRYLADPAARRLW